MLPNAFCLPPSPLLFVGSSFPLTQWVQQRSRPLAESFSEVSHDGLAASAVPSEGVTNTGVFPQTLANSLKWQVKNLRLNSHWG